VSLLQGLFDGVQHAFEIVIELLVFKADDFQTLLLQIPRSLSLILIYRDGKVALPVQLYN
jgi:hypothetical protein